MKETSFIKKNKDKWSRFEELYASTKNDPEELSNLYMDITEDLSYAQTFYKRRTVRVYLNQLAQKVFLGVHKQKGESLRKLFSVWKTSLPLEIYRSRKNLQFALIAFIIYVAIGVITTYYNPDFPRIVMGDGYVDMTISNIEKGNPLAVYEAESQMSMFIQITTNNLKVAFLTFFVGFFLTIGTHMLLFFNGVMLGSFQFFFYSKGLLITTFLGIWIHGAFEISAIVLAGGAGLTAGNGWLFPKSYTRLQGLQLSARRGLKIMLSLVPFIIAAGFLESYVTHNYQALPEWSKWLIIFFSFALIIGYYVVYPIYVARKHPELVDQEDTHVFQDKDEIKLYKIRPIGELIADTFQFYKRFFNKFGRIIFGVVMPIALIITWIQGQNHVDSMQAEHWYDWQAHLAIIFGYNFQNGTDWLVALTWSILFTVIFASIFWSFKSMNNPNDKGFLAYIRSHGIKIWSSNLLLFLTVFFLPWYILLFVLFLIPFLTLNAATAGLADKSFSSVFKLGFTYSSKHYGTSILILILLLALVVILSQPIAFVFSINEGWRNEPLVLDLLDYLANFTKRIAALFTDDTIVWANRVRQVVYLTFVLLVMPLYVIWTCFAFYSIQEKTEAIGLKEEFKKFGKRKRHQETTVDFE